MIPGGCVELIAAVLQFILHFSVILFIFQVQAFYMKKLLLVLVLLLSGTFLFAQQKPAYVLYDANGKKVSYKKMIKLLAKKTFCFSANFITTPSLTGLN